jgi:hypothetical protein
MQRDWGRSKDNAAAAVGVSIMYYKEQRARERRD